MIQYNFLKDTSSLADLAVVSEFFEKQGFETFYKTTTWDARIAIRHKDFSSRFAWVFFLRNKKDCYYSTQDLPLDIILDSSDNYQPLMPVSGNSRDELTVLLGEDTLVLVRDLSDYIDVSVTFKHNEEIFRSHYITGYDYNENELQVMRSMKLMDKDGNPGEEYNDILCGLAGTTDQNGKYYLGDVYIENSEEKIKVPYTNTISRIGANAICANGLFFSDNHISLAGNARFNSPSQLMIGLKEV